MIKCQKNIVLTIHAINFNNNYGGFMYPKKLFKNKTTVFLFLLFAMSLSLSTIHAQLLNDLYNYELLAKASPDEDYYGIGNPNNNYNPFITTFNGVPKVNQAYVWGLTQVDDQLWFGTAPNVHCLVMGGYLGADLPHETDCWTCEFGDNQFSDLLPAIIGDWRPSRIFMYDLATDELVDKTPFLSPLLNLTLGLRSAGSIGNIVFLGGPSLTGSGIAIFAFDASTGAYLGEKLISSLPDGSTPNNIRKWLLVDGELYLGVGVGDLLSLNAEGRILKWTGTLAEPFNFEIVGEIRGDAAELVEHEGRIFVNTWGGPTGIWMSPIIPTGGLTNSDKDDWSRVWGIENYEVDPVTMNTTGGGALASYDGYLFWGTMHVPMMSAGVHMRTFNPDTPSEIAAAILGTYRAISIFRGKNFGEASQEVDLLYGQEYLPAYNPATGWSIKSNNMPNKAPLFGLSGFGNLMNNYTWTMNVFNDKLYIGTMDWSFLVAGGIASLLDVNLNEDQLINLDELIPNDFSDTPYNLSDSPIFSNINLDVSSFDFSALENLLRGTQDISIPPLGFGADLWYFDSPTNRAKPLSVNGVGNKTSYGIRTMVSSESDLFLGMANPMNLSEYGGWELIKINENSDPFDNKVTSVDEKRNQNEFYLENNYPNPFNPSTTIKFNLPEASEVSLEVFNSLGQLVGILEQGNLAKGVHEYEWNAYNFTSGIYFYKIKYGNKVEIKRMTLLK